MKRKILFVSSNFPPVTGGSSVVYDQLCHRLAAEVVALGSSCSYSTGEPFPDLGEQDAGRDYLIYRLPFLRPSLTSKRCGRIAGLMLYDLPIMLRVLATILVLILRHGCRVVCIGDLVANGWLVFPLRYLLLRRVVLYTHGEEVSQENNTLAGRLRRFVLRHAHIIVSVSDFCKGQIISQYGIPAEKIFVVPNGVDLSVFRRGKRDIQVLPEAIRSKRILLSVSRLVERKGQEKLIEAMPQVVARVPDAHCVLVGDGPLAERLRGKADEVGMSSHVTFTGAVSLEDLVRLYQASEVFVLPCRTLEDGDTEGFGLVFLEANACGLPVVAGAAGGTVEAVTDGETGLVIDGSQTDEIAGAILSLLNDRDYAAILSETGWLRSQTAGWDAAAGKFLDVCKGRADRPDGLSYRPRPEALAFAPQIRRGEISRLLLTVDVEEQFDWKQFPRTDFQVGGVNALADFHDRCRELGISPVYLVTHAIMADPAFCRFLSGVMADGSGEVGIHLHAWNTPPFWEFTNSFNSFQCNLPEHVERRKLETICRRFEEVFGRPARIHRAGRWGGSSRTASLLGKLGFDVDLSPSPSHRDQASGGPDFRNLGHVPFWAGDGETILVIPVSTSLFIRGPEWLSSRLIDHWPLVPPVSDWLRKAFGTPLRFSPEGESTERLLTMMRTFRTRPVSVLTLHSTSLYVGGGPYAPTPQSVAETRERCLMVLRECLRTGEFQFSTCASLYRDAKKQKRNVIAQDNKKNSI